MTEAAALKGKLGRVSCSIPPEGGGEVLIEVRGGAEAFTAYPAEPRSIAVISQHRRRTSAGWMRAAATASGKSATTRL